MCQIIVIDKGETEIENVKQFEDYFKVNLGEGLIRECCLCQLDLDEELKKRGLEYEYDCGDYYIKSTNTPAPVTTNNQ